MLNARLSATARLPRSLGRRRLHVAASAQKVSARWCLEVRYGQKRAALQLMQEWCENIGSRAGLNAANCQLSTGAIGVSESLIEVRRVHWIGRSHSRSARSNDASMLSMQMEVTFATLAAWEQFLASIPAQEHFEWSTRLQVKAAAAAPAGAWLPWHACCGCSACQQGCPQRHSRPPAAQGSHPQTGAGNRLVALQDKVLGSPVWHVYRTCPVFSSDASAPARPTVAARQQPAAAASATSSSSSASGLILDADLDVLKTRDFTGKGGASGLGWPWIEEEAAAAAAAWPAPPADGGVPPAPADAGSDGGSAAPAGSDEQLFDWKGDPMTINPGDKLPFKFL
jgi:hypothetical protein